MGDGRKRVNICRKELIRYISGANNLKRQMSLTIERVQTARQLRKFINFPLWLYKNMPAFVPSLYMDEKDTLSPKKNPAYDFCDAAMFLAIKDGQVVGRVAAIVNRRANEKWQHDEVRFGWFDFIDDREVSELLLDQVVAFGKERGMTKIVGPLGFTDFDPEGMLVDGYDQMSTMALHHNWPYYKDHVEALGYEKEVDWLEYKVYVPSEVPDKYTRVGALVKERYGLHIRKITRKDVRNGIGYKLFDLINETYSSIYNFTILPKKMIDKYVGFYLGVLDLKFVTLVEDSEGKLVGFGITMPSITRALKKCNGRLFPFGWFHVLKSMYFKYEENIEMLLIGVTEEYRKKGVSALIFSDLMRIFINSGFTYAETNAELENNYAVRAQWMELDYEQCKRRRVYWKTI